MLNTKPGTSLQAVERIRVKTKGVIAADAIFGSYDAIVIIEAPTHKDINNIVYKIIEKDPTVTRTQTFIALDEM